MGGNNERETAVVGKWGIKSINTVKLCLFSLQSPRYLIRHFCSGHGTSLHGDKKIQRAILTCVNERFHFVVAAWPVLFQSEYLCLHLQLEAEIYTSPVL